MKIEGRLLTPDTGYRLTDGEGCCRAVLLGCNDSAANYAELAEADIPTLDAELSAADARRELREVMDL